MEAAADRLHDPVDESLPRRSGGVLSVAGQVAISDEFLNAVQRRVHDAGTFRLTARATVRQTMLRNNILINSN
jgi:hypothetical protein